jgi:hypothetical protein
MEPIVSPETSVLNQLAPHNNPEDRRIQIYSLPSYAFQFFPNHLIPDLTPQIVGVPARNN